VIISDVPIFIGEQVRRLVSVKVTEKVRFVIFCGATPSSSDILRWVRANITTVPITTPSLETAFPPDLLGWVLIDSENQLAY